MEKDNISSLEFFSNQKRVRDQLARKEIFLFLDYDGTLTPIVDTPDLAVLSEEMRAIVQQAAGKLTVSIVSGRATDDVRSKVKIDKLFYAGSHGFEIVDPNGNVTINEEAKQIQKIIDEVHSLLTAKVQGIPGVLVEHVKYTISAHYRLVSEEDFPKVKQAVEEVVEKHPQLRKTEGKKVFEIRPNIDWDKGKAVNWILDFLKFDPTRQVAVYLGDDTTDEDAFAVLKGKGFGIFVATQPRSSLAEYFVADTSQVRDVLSFFINL